MSKTECNVLVVDDEFHICTVLRRILVREGYMVKAVSNGNTALNIIVKNHPDVILLDLMMPGINGREICSIVRHLSSETRVIYFTAKIETNPSVLKEIEKEADGFIRKPATARRILNEIDNVLRQSQVRTPISIG